MAFGADVHLLQKLPRNPSFVDGGEGVVPKEERPAANSLKVLLVDDSELFLDFERAVFETVPCQILTANHWELAVATARREKPHIILLDYKMPGKWGDEVCRILKKDALTRQIPILVLTGLDQENVRKRCFEAGAKGVLSKPIAGRELLAEVLKTLQATYQSPVRSLVSLEIITASSAARRRTEGFAEAVSETGMLLEVAEDIPQGSRLLVEFTLPGYTLPLKLNAEVVHGFEKKARGQYVAGIRFVKIPLPFRWLLRQYVQAHVHRAPGTSVHFGGSW